MPIDSSLDVMRLVFLFLCFVNLRVRQHCRFADTIELWRRRAFVQICSLSLCSAILIAIYTNVTCVDIHS
jgi:hypothetical protein